MKLLFIIIRPHFQFEVEKTDQDTRIEICCAANPGLLLSTIRELESMGLDIQQCVISCFNDFSLQATCCEVDHSLKCLYICYAFGLKVNLIKYLVFI